MEVLYRSRMLSMTFRCLVAGGNSHEHASCHFAQVIDGGRGHYLCKYNITYPFDCVVLEVFLDTGFQFHRVEGFQNEVFSSGFKQVDAFGGTLFAGKHNDRDVS